MAQKLYLDTSIWRDYYENRSDKFRPLGEWALELLNKTIHEKGTILYSDLVVEELNIKYAQQEIDNIFSFVRMKGILVKADISREQANEAVLLCKKKKVAFGDVLHAILARDYKAIMVTRDKHFQELSNIVEIKKPEELL
ncbi:MAG: hypothetical protein QS98_C0003G0066 [archaeon GW2011_AR3]|nr:MAG: hypothetical protein QS98_C0003G0066 [archaeon GW2011_AR3]MBS3110108.1 type II toxin-antitoxin system VapC family toxin [Candidatus Woesearchaeota archaeon]